MKLRIIKVVNKKNIVKYQIEESWKGIEWVAQRTLYNSLKEAKMQLYKFIRPSFRQVVLEVEVEI
jgi:hypothetical protein